MMHLAYDPLDEAFFVQLRGVHMYKLILFRDLRCKPKDMDCIMKSEREKLLTQRGGKTG